MRQLFHRHTPCHPLVPSHRYRDAFARINRSLLTSDSDDLRFERSITQYEESQLTDYYFVSSLKDAQPLDVFPKLRWGGQVVFASSSLRKVKALQGEYEKRPEFIVEQGLSTVHNPRWGKRWLPGQEKVHYFVARKVLIVEHGQFTDRYSYDVRLVPARSGMDDDYVVLKQIPSMEDAVNRLAQRFPDMSEEIIQKSARKLIEKVFPLFLTREAAFLKLIHQQLPESYRNKFSQVVGVEKDARGFVSKLYLKWMRLGGKTMSQLEFARQSAELLKILHEDIRLWHLDLRLDNFVITEHGVGLIDFGSAVRVDEDIKRSPLLAKLYGEMLSTSQVQRDLKRFIERGRVTSPIITDSYQKIHRGSDLFYLVLQMNKPHLNPDFRGLVEFDPQSEEALHLGRLSQAIFKPANPSRPQFTTASDVLAGIRQVARAVA